MGGKYGKKLQKQVIFDKTTCFCWSEMGDSNSRHLAPKASALPTALIPDLVIEFCARCGQTCGQAVFLTTSTCRGSACIAGVSRDCGHCISRLEGGATRSQTRRDTNFAIPGYSISAIISRRGRKSKIFLSVVIYVVKAAFMPFSTAGGNPAKAGVARLCGVSPCPVPDTATALPKRMSYQLGYVRIFGYSRSGTREGRDQSSFADGCARDRGGRLTGLKAPTRQSQRPRHGKKHQ